MSIFNRKKKPILCEHSHTIEDHPKCFSEGKIIDRRKDKTTPWYTEPGMKLGYLDIESDGLKADFSTMLTWCIKEKDGPIASDYVNKKELFEGKADERIIKSLVEELRKYKIIIGYFSTGFDIPFVRTKALHYGLDFPSYGELYHWDLYYTVKSKLNLSRKSLDNACDYLGIKGKTPIDKEVWRRAKYGDPKALVEVLEHNRGDVRITELLHDKIAFTRKWIKSSI
jgi:uncharacterized protein YprB with RNaseH-like and TPR domain